MDISIFEASGPVMIGPSSSHTAGAARLSRIARDIVAKPFTHVSFGLYASFAKTYKGHGTDRALVAGALGLYEDDERLRDAFRLAEDAGLGYDFYETELEGAHENSVLMTFTMVDGTKQQIVGSSIGGAQILITRINNFKTEFTAKSPTLVTSQYDKKGVLSRVTRILFESDINIGAMKLSREEKGQLAFCLIETDTAIPDEVVDRIRGIENLISVQALNLTEGGTGNV